MLAKHWALMLPCEQMQSMYLMQEIYFSSLYTSCSTEPEDETSSFHFMPGHQNYFTITFNHIISNLNLKSDILSYMGYLWMEDSCSHVNNSQHKTGTSIWLSVLPLQHNTFSYSCFVIIVYFSL